MPIQRLSPLLAGLDVKCISCLAVGDGDRVMERRISLQEGDDALVRFRCPHCGRTLGPYLVAVIDGQPESRPRSPRQPRARQAHSRSEIESEAEPAKRSRKPSIQLASPQEVSSLTKKPEPRKSHLALPVKKEPVSQEELIEMCAENLPDHFEIKGGEFYMARKIERFSQTMHPDFAPIQGVTVIYGESGPARGGGRSGAAIINFDIKATVLCEDGEPDWDKELKDLKAMYIAKINGLPENIRIVRRVSSGPNEQRFCGECGQPRVNNRCACAGGKAYVLGARALSADRGAETPIAELQKSGIVLPSEVEWSDAARSPEFSQVNVADVNRRRV